MEAQDIKDKTEDLVSHTGEYLDTFFKISLLKVTKKTTDIASGAISVMVVCILGMLVFFFGGFAAAWWLGDVIGSRAGGFLLIAGFFIIVGGCIISLRKKMIFPYIRNLLIRKVYDKSN